MNTDELRELCLRVAPELRPPAQLYVLQHDDDFPPPPAGCCAYAQPVTVRPRLRDLLVERGQWKGAGPAIVMRDGFSPGEMLGILAHELAHLLPHKPPPPDVEPDELDREIDDLAIKHAAAGQLDDPKRPPWWPSHGREFTRISCHLWWRFALFADIILPADFAAGGRYGLSPLSAYLSAIDHEPLRMRGEDFSTILVVESPDFEELWQHDTTAWIERHIESDDWKTSERKTA